jgi:hypothetical protein
MTTAADLSVSPKARRRWLRFRLRTLFVLVTLACVWLGWQGKRAREQKAAVAAVHGAGGTLFYSFQYGSSGGLLDTIRPVVPAWLRDFLGEDFFITVQGVSLGTDAAPADGRLTVDARVTDAMLQRLKPLRGLKNLSLRSTQATDTGLEAISSMDRLEVLEIDGPKFTDLGANHLARLPQLRHLVIGGEQLSDRSIAAIQSLPKLRFLELRGGQMTNDGLADLKHFPALRSLSLVGPTAGASGVQITGAGLRHVAAISRLESLNLECMNVHDVDLLPLERLKNLRAAAFNLTSVTPAGMAMMRQMFPSALLSAGTSAGIMNRATLPAPAAANAPSSEIKLPAAADK